MRTLFFIVLACLLVTACSQNDDTKTSTAPSAPAPRAERLTPVAAPEPLKTQQFLQQPLEAALFETPNQALPLWRKYAKGRPALVLLSNAPYIQVIPAELLVEAEELLATAADSDLVQRSSEFYPDPILLPMMSARAAMRSGYFSRVVWIFPSKVPVENLKLQVFQAQLQETGLATQDEIESFTLDAGVFRGTVAGTPFWAVHDQASININEPVLLHIDLSYISPLYKGEIKTPLYPLLATTLAHLKDQQWQIAGASICRSNQPGGLPLDTRFIGKDLAEMLRNPSTLAEKPLSAWERRAEALYLENFMRKEEIREIYLTMEKAAPKDPSVKYALYQNARQFREVDKALDYLRQAVTLDPVYANEYLALADLAMEKKGPAKALEMLQIAREKRPDNPFILLNMVRMALNAGQRDVAVGWLNELQKTTWSDVYFPGITSEIRELLLLAQGG